MASKVPLPDDKDAWRYPTDVGTKTDGVYLQKFLKGWLTAIYVTNTTANAIAITLRIVPRGTVESKAHDLLSATPITGNELFSWEGRVPFDNGDVLTVFASALGLILRVIVEEEI